MIFGAMNNPALDILDEIQNIYDLGFDFIDLTIEYPKCSIYDIDKEKVKALLEKLNFPCVVHSAYYLPFSNPYKSVRQSAVNELKQLIDITAFLGAKYCNLHFGYVRTLFTHKDLINAYIDCFEELIPYAKEKDITLVMENVPGKDKKQIWCIRKIMSAVPDLGLHLDIAHSNIEGGIECTEKYLRKFGDRLHHVHISDNDGSGDQHMHLGFCDVSINWEKVFQLLRDVGYNKTITLEIFNGAEDGLLRGLRKVREWCEV